MSVQTITLLIAVLSLVCLFGTMYGIQALVKQGKDPGKELQIADTFVDTAVAANSAVKSFIPAPVEGIIDTVLKVTQAGVHSAQQLYNSGQLTPDLRKDKASEYAINMIKLTGHEVTPELEQSIRDTAEAAVFVMKQKDPVPVVVPGPIPVIVQPDMPVQESTAPLTDDPQTVVDPDQQTA